MSRTHRFFAVVALLFVCSSVALVGQTTVRAQQTQEEGTVLASNGYDPYKDDFTFNNNFGPINYANDFTKESLVRMFGAETVCKNGANGNCVLTPCAAEWLAFVNNQLLPGGRCLGMVALRLKMFYNPEIAYHYEPSSGMASIIQQRTIAADIGFESVKQKTRLIARLINEANATTPQNVVADLQAQLQANVESPVLLISFAFRQNGSMHVYGHALLPYKLVQMNENQYRIYVSDPNKQFSTDAYVSVDTAANTWQYTMRWPEGTPTPDFPINWSGSATSRTNRIALLGLDAFYDSVDLQGPVCRGSVNSGGTALASADASAEEVSVIGENAQVLFTDAQGRRLGFIGEELVNEIPGAEVSLPMAYGSMPVVYRLPPPYTIKLTGSGQANVIKFGAENSVSISDIDLTSSEIRLGVSPNGNNVNLWSPQEDEVTVSMGLNQDGTGNTGWIKVQHVDVPAQYSLQIVATDRLVITGFRDSGTYDLELDRITDTGTVTFTVSEIPVQAGDTQQIGYGQWDSTITGTMPITVTNPTAGTSTGDLGNGETPVLETGEPSPMRVFLPLIVR